MYDTTKTFQNVWHGSVNQESASVTTLCDDTSYDGKGYTSFGFEYEPGPSGQSFPVSHPSFYSRF